MFNIAQLKNISCKFRFINRLSAFLLCFLHEGKDYPNYMKVFIHMSAGCYSPLCATPLSRYLAVSAAGQSVLCQCPYLLASPGPPPPQKARQHHLAIGRRTSSSSTWRMMRPGAAGCSSYRWRLLGPGAASAAGGQQLL
jgi:hypothetical protein